MKRNILLLLLGLLGTLARLTPHGQALEGYFRIMADGAGVAEVLVPVAILLGMSALKQLEFTQRGDTLIIRQ